MSKESLSSNTEQSAIKQGSSSYARYVFWIMFATVFLNYLDRTLLTGAANTVAHELGLGVASIGYVASAFLVVYAVCTVPMGLWADRAKRKNVVAFCVAVWCTATALTALSFNFLSLFLSRVVLGIGQAGYFPAGTALLSDYFSRKKRARIMSWWNVGLLVGILFGFVLGGAVAGLYVGSWRLAFVFTGIPGLALALLSWRLREPRHNEADEGQALRSGFAEGQEIAPHTTTPIATNMLLQLRNLLRIKTLIALIVMQIFAFFVLGVTVVFLPTFLQQKDLYGLDSGFAGTFSGGVIVLAGSIGTVGGGYLADLLSRRSPGARVLVCGIGFLISAPTFALALTASSFALFALFFVLATVFVTLYTGPSAAATQDVVPSPLRASAVAISLFIAHTLGDAFSPTLVGVLTCLFDPTSGTHFAHNLAGHDLSHAMLVTCTPALVIAGLVGIIGARWMKGDLVAAAEADRFACQASSPISPI